MFKKLVCKFFATMILVIVGSGILALIFLSVKATGANSLYAIQAYTGSKDITFGVVLLGLLAEIVLTFLFVLAVLGATSKKEHGHATGIIIGLALFGVHLLGIPMTGTSVNPARAFSAILFNMFAEGTNIGHSFLTLIAVLFGPLVGAALAAYLWKKTKPSEEK